MEGEGETGRLKIRLEEQGDEKRRAEERGEERRGGRRKEGRREQVLRLLLGHLALGGGASYNVPIDYWWAEANPRADPSSHCWVMIAWHSQETHDWDPAQEDILVLSDLVLPFSAFQVSSAMWRHSCCLLIFLPLSDLTRIPPSSLLGGCCRLLAQWAK